MAADGAHADKIESKFATTVGGFGIEVEQDLHVIGDEADGNDGDVPSTARFELGQIIAHVGLKPRLSRRATAALIDELPIAPTYALRDEPAGLGELELVVTALGPRERDAM